MKESFSVNFRDLLKMNIVLKERISTVSLIRFLNLNIFLDRNRAEIIGFSKIHMEKKKSDIFFK